MCPACDVTAWDREEQQYSGLEKGPHAEIYVAPKRFEKNKSNWKYILSIL